MTDQEQTATTTNAAGHVQPEPVTAPAADGASESDQPVDPASQGVPSAPAVAAAERPHYLSMVAFALGLAGIVAPGIHALAAIVIGHIGLAKEPSGRTFAIIGLVAGYVVTAMFIIGIVIAISVWGVLLSSFLAALPFSEFSPR